MKPYSEPGEKTESDEPEIFLLKPFTPFSQFRPFRSKYSIFYPKMNPTKPDEDENKNTSGQTWSQDKNELGRGANENQANNEGIQGHRKENMKEGTIEGQNANDRENMAKLDENKAEFTI